MEAWKKVVGYEGLYEVSNTGKVRSLIQPTSVGMRTRKAPLELKQRGSRGHLCVSLYKDGVSSHLYVHSIVAEAFIGKRPDGAQCCHNDGNYLNNFATNLRWDFASGNQQDRVKHGTDVRGLKHPRAKLSDEQVVEIRNRLAKGEKGKSLAVEFAVSAAHISRIKLNQVKDWI